MRYVFLPISLFLYYTVVYFALLGLLLVMFWIFSWSWLWLIVGLTMVSGLFFGVLYLIPAALSYIILKFYNGNYVIAKLHAIAALISIITFFYYMFTDNSGIVTDMWAYSWFKTIVIGIPFAVSIVSFSVQQVLNPLMNAKEN